MSLCCCLKFVARLLKRLLKPKDASKEPLRIYPIPVERVGMYAWSDASNPNRSSGHSTKGIFIGAADKGLSEGSLEKISPMYWQSSKIDRVCRAPGAWEAHTAIDSEDVLYLIWFQWSELLGTSLTNHVRTFMSVKLVALW